MQNNFAQPKFISKSEFPASIFDFIANRSQTQLHGEFAHTKESTWPIAIHYQISSFQVKLLATKRRSKKTQIHDPSDLGINWLCLCDLAHFFYDDSEAR